MMILPPQVNMALDMLCDAGYEAYVVGGAVRDYVRENKQGHDWDITTSALPEEVEQVFCAFPVIETGLKHGTVTAMIGHEPLEITTYRIDGEYTDHRRPDEVHFTRSLKEDLARRDFTMNALAYNPRVGVVDLNGGLNDIKLGLVRCVGEPNRRFQEDALRILRALRFASVFGMQIEPETAKALHHNKDLLRAIAAERVQAELTKMLCGSGIQYILREYADVIAVVIPEIIPMFGFEQHNPHHSKDVWNHTITVTASIKPEPVFRWAALLHDIGKPHCFSLDGSGIGHFYHHASISAELANSILKRLRFDNTSAERIALLVKNHDTPLPAEQKGVKRMMNRLGADATLQLIEIHRADTAGQHPSCFVRYEEFRRVEKLVTDILEEESCFSLKDLTINGNTLLNLGFKGKIVGDILHACLDAVIDEKVENSPEQLIAFVRQNYTS